MRLVAIVLTIAFVPTAIALGAGPDHGYTDFRTELSASTVVLPGATAAVLAECDPGEHAAGGGFHVSGDASGVEVRQSRRVAIAPRLEGWDVTVHNAGAQERLVSASAVCESG